ncbi:gfo/Idh/MocA family oxidoreductase, partial [bacterium]|nr:gfo/Idh/MocA family oxidoreductase [bacterium]
MGFDCTVVEPSEVKRAIAKNRGYISFKSLNDIQLKSEHSVAFVCTPPAYHIEQTIWALEREMRVFLEKPIGIGLKECRKLLSYDHSKIFVGYTYRWNLQFIALRQTIETGQIGTPYFANFSMGMHLEDWHPQENYREFFMSKKSLGGGALLDESHFIDLALALFGIPNKILGTVSKISELEIDSDDYVNIEMQYNSLIANITMNLFKRPHESKIEVYGTKGSIICDFTNKVNIPVDYERHSEVRQIADSIILDLFKTLVGNNKDIAETMKSSTSATSTSLSLPESGLGLHSPPVGKPLCGVYYEEIVPELPLVQLCVRE